MFRQIFAFLGSLAALFSVIHHPAVQSIHNSVLPAATPYVKISITMPSPTASPSATPTSISDAYHDQLKVALNAQLDTVNSELSKWKEALTYWTDARKTQADFISQQLRDSASNGTPLSPASLLSSLTAYDSKIQTAQDEIYKLQAQQMQLLIQLNSTK